MTRRAPRVLVPLLAGLLAAGCPAVGAAAGAGPAEGPGPPERLPAAAGGYGAVPAGWSAPGPVASPNAPGPGGGGPGADLAVPLALVAGVLAAAGYAYGKRRRRVRTRTTPHGGAPLPGGAEPDERTGRALAEADERTRRVLVETDDAVRTSREELGIAAARCGAAAVGPFAGAVAYAEAELAAAFGLRQRLDEAGSRDGAARRAALEEITARCADAERRLDEVAAAFDELRDLERTAPEALADAEAAHRDLTGRLATAEAALTAMRARYADAAAAPVAEAPGEAGARLAFAAENLARAREALDAPAAPGEGPRPGPDSGRPSAVPYLRAAEGAVGQAARLIGAVDRRAVELAEAAGRLPEALAEAETDLAEARGALEGGAPRAGLRGRAARLEAVVREVRRAVEAGRYDPADALRRTEEAHAALDEALARRGGARRARAFLDRSLSAARSSVDAAEDYLATHRGAVAGVARTRLAEARRLLAAASGAGADADPRAALAEARRADALARQARVLAERDVRLRGGPGGPDGPGSAVVGGILPTGPPGAPASFGGGGTRGRLGGGGRS